MGGHRTTYRDFPAELHSCYSEGVLGDLSLLLLVLDQDVFDVLLLMSGQKSQVLLVNLRISQFDMIS
jgi:hypothetical protein